MSLDGITTNRWRGETADETELSTNRGSWQIGASNEIFTNIS